MELTHRAQVYQAVKRFHRSWQFRPFTDPNTFTMDRGVLTLTVSFTEKGQLREAELRYQRHHWVKLEDREVVQVVRGGRHKLQRTLDLLERIH